MDGAQALPLSLGYGPTVDALRETFKSGKTRPLEWRKQQLTGLADAMERAEGKITEALRKDLGKPRAESLIAEVDYVTKECRRAARKCEGWAKPRWCGTPLSSLPATSRLVPEPFGVALIIGAWNYPVQEIFGPLAGAIAAGNCAVLKPSELAPHAAELVREIAEEALDPDAFAVVLGGAEETSELLKERFDKIFYTGGAHVGRIVMEAASKHLTPVTLELGGKSPAIVAKDADLEVSARRLVWAAFMNGGQLCVRPDYCMVEEEVYEPLLEKMKETAESFYGENMLQSDDLCSIVNGRHFDRVAKLLGSGDVVVGGKTDREKLKIAPTILRDVKPDAPAMQEEIFGPVLPTFSVKSLDEAIAFVNERDKPLALYAFTATGPTSDRIIKETSSGTVMVNDAVLFQTNHYLPFGGVGESGMGAFHGRHSFDGFSHLKAVMTRPFWGDVALRYPPYTEKATNWLRKLL